MNSTFIHKKSEIKREVQLEPPVFYYYQLLKEIKCKTDCNKEITSILISKTECHFR